MHFSIKKAFKFLGIASIVVLLIAVSSLLYTESKINTTAPSRLNTEVVKILEPVMPSATPVPPQPVTIIFTGDVMLDRHIRTNAEKNGYDSLLDENLKNMFQNVDHVIVNLEGPITTNTSVSVGSAVGSSNNYLFTFDPVVTEFLKTNNMSPVNLGNNHILNFGEDGLQSTYQYLDAANIAYFGNPGSTAQSDQRVTTLQHQGLTIGLVNYNQFVTNGFETALADLKAIRDSVDLVFLYTHWGNEYVPENQVLISQAHEFIDAGADGVIGSHPHVITGTEEYAGKKIYYSLGNFIFDQYFEPAVKEGMIVKVTIDPSTKIPVYEEHRVTMTLDGKTSLDADSLPASL